VNAPVPVRDAATVMLVRDGDGGLEVFMMRRTLQAAFVGGFYVFPGGAVDAADRGAEVDAVCDGLDDAAASEALGVASGGLAYWVAAVRECFEEAGVLLAAGGTGEVVRFDDPAVAARFTEHRHAVHAGTTRLVDVCRAEGLQLVAGDIAYVSHWITPEGEPRRFDTRFFVARAPAAQEPLHDDGETIASLWVRPADALQRCQDGELAMIVPTIKNLELLLPWHTADEALAGASAIRRPPTIQPRLRIVDGQVAAVLLPGEPGFDELGPDGG
jgi:8-oxo-dGTP pyrophosphatase MutT (NUDIX family)